MEILDFYKGLLTSAGITADDKGQCVNTLAGLSQPVTISGKKLMLPTAEVLESNQWDKVIGFHPASESVIRGESPVLRKLRKAFQNRINYILMTVFEHAVSIAASTDTHEKLNPTQSALLRVLSNVDEKSIALVRKMINAVDMESNDNKFVNLYIKKEGIVGGKSFKRATIVTFPIYQSMEVTEPTIFGVTLRQKDKKAFLALMEYILPKSGETGSYDAGSHDLNVPALDCLVQAVAQIFVKLNDFVLLYKDVIPGADELATDLGWYEGMEEIVKYRAQIPALEGNQGVSHRNEQEVKPVAGSGTFTLKDKEPVQQPTSNTGYHQPEPAVQRTQAGSDGVKRISYNDYLQQRNAEMGAPMHPQMQPPPYGHPGYQQPAYPAPYGAPPGPNYQPGYPAPGYQPPASYQGYNAGAGMSPGRASAVASAYQNPYGYSQPQPYGYHTTGRF